MADGIIVSTIMDSPGRIHLAFYEGQGADAKTMRKELSLFDMEQMHLKLTAALYYRLMNDDKR